MLVSTTTGLLPSPGLVTVDDVLELKGVSSPMVSPDGTRVLYTVRAWEPASDKEPNQRESRTRVWMVPVAGGPARQLTFGQRGDSQPQWSPDGRSISFLSARGTGTGDDAPRPQVYVMRSDGGEARRVTDAKEGVATYAWAPDSRRIAFVATEPRSSEETAKVRSRDDERVFEGDLRYRHVWVVEIADSSVATPITSGQDYTVDAGPLSWSPDGSRIVFSAGLTSMLRDERQDVYIAEVATKQITKISTNFGRDSRPQWSPDGTAHRVGGRPQHRQTQWRWDTGQPDHAVAPDDLRRRGPGHQGRLVAVVRSRSRDAAVEPGWQRASSSRRVSVPTPPCSRTTSPPRDTPPSPNAAPCSSARRAATGRSSRCLQDSPESPNDVYVTGPDFRTFNRLTTTNPQAAQFALGASEVVTWKSDGWTVEGVLLKPVGFEAGKRYPLLVVAHGGPAGAFVNNYRVGGLEGGQLWAGQGWAVFYPNPRGSTNYGEKFLRANINDWGGGDYRDIMTGIDALVARGIADPDKLALIGWSYGGYMTAWSITQTARFKAAMVGAGLTNLWSMYGTNDIPNVLIGYFGGQAGPERLPLYMERSAMTRIDKVVTPTLILHGGSDERVPIGQAQELFRGLKDRGKATELVFYPREGHGITEYYHQKDRLTRIQDWISRYTLGEAARKTSSQ